jgi:hypothetical protein
VTKTRITALGLFGFSVLYLYGGWHLKWGTMKNPGPGFMPSLVGVLLFICTGIHVYRTFTGGRRDEGPSQGTGIHGPRYGVVLGIFACVVLFPLLLVHLKYLLCSSALVLVMLLLLRYKTPLMCLAAAVLISLVSYLIFARLLGVALPMGFAEEFIYALLR